MNTLKNFIVARIYHYDSIGNMVYSSAVGNMNYATNQPHQLTSATGYNLGYDNAGNVTNNGIDVYQYDWRNRMVYSKIYNSPNKIYYEYDHNNQRYLKYSTHKVYHPYPCEYEGPMGEGGGEGLDGGGDMELDSDCGGYYSDDKFAETKYVEQYFEKDFGGNTKDHIYLGSMKLATVNNTSTPYFIIADHLGSNSTVTDSSGNISEYLDYEPFGKVFYNQEIQNSGNEFRFTGKLLDSESNLQYFGARYLENNVARFYSVDPVLLKLQDNKQLKDITAGNLEEILKNPQKLNSYNYVFNNPVNAIDPDGQYGWETVKTAGIGSWQMTKGLWNMGSSITEATLAGMSLAVGRPDVASLMFTGSLINLDEAMVDTANGFNNIVGNALIHDKAAVNIKEEGPYKELAKNFVGTEAIDSVELGANIMALGAKDIPSYYNKTKGALEILKNAKLSGVGQASENYIIYKSLDLGRNLLDSTSQFISGQTFTDKVEGWLYSK